jgi:hypothetical protein
MGESVGCSASTCSSVSRKGSSFDVRCGRRPVARRLWRFQGLAHRVTVDTGAAVDLALRETFDVLHAPDLRPLLHAQQRLSPVSTVRSSQIRDPVGRSDPVPQSS